MNKKLYLSFGLFIFYVAIIMYVLLSIIRINVLENFVSGLVFEFIGFACLAYFIFVNFYKTTIKVGFLIPLIVTTVIYTIALDVITMTLITSMSNRYYILVNMLLLFLYGIAAIPMYLMGENKTDNRQEEIK